MMTEKPFNKQTIVEGLKECGFPVSDIFWREFRDMLLEKTGKDSFIFKSKKPIFVGMLETIQNRACNYQNKYSSKNTKHEPEEVPIIENDPKATIQFAIDLLKEEGYLICKPVGTVYEEI